MDLANITQVSTSSSFYRETNNNYLPNNGNQFNFSQSGGAINNIAYEGQSSVSMFAKNLDLSQINMISFQQFIQKQLVVVDSSGKTHTEYAVKTFLKQFSDLFVYFFAPHYQAPKLIISTSRLENGVSEIAIEMTLSPQTKIFITFADKQVFLTYRHEKELSKKEVNLESLLENLADLFAQYGTKHDLVRSGSVFL
jgi:hypothetical protein